MSTLPSPLAASDLTAQIDLSHLNIESTADLDGVSSFLGQPRAKKSLEFGIAMRGSGYNLYVMGDSGTGRQSLVSKYVRGLAESQQAPSEWAYINNFESPREPSALEVPAGRGDVLKEQIQQLVNDLMDTFPSAFENPTYQRKRTMIDREFNQKYDMAIKLVERFANEKEVAVVADGGSVMLLPVIDGKALDDTEFAQLPEQVRSEFQSRINDIEEYLNEQVLELPTWRRKSSEKLRQLNLETVQQAIRPLIKELEVKNQSQLSILRYIREVKNHLPQQIVDLFAEESMMDTRTDQDRRAALEGWLKPNLMTQHEINDGAPVIYEMLPTYQNLFGRIEYATQQGIPITNYQLIRPGSLLRANGGYLILDAEKLLIEPYAWDALKLALKTKELKMESPYADASLMHAVTLSPESIRLNVKVVLLGSRDIYYQLQEWDPEFMELFRVPVDFDSFIPSNRDNIDNLILRIKDYGETKGFKPLTKAALERLIEYSLREAEHQKRLSAQVAKVFKVFAEADYISRHKEARFIEASHVTEALEAADYRNSRIADQMLQEIEEGTILIDTDGQRVGCVNGLTVMEIGESCFGSPARITATVHVGGKGVVDIEREVELGQSIHSKGVMILSGFLGHEFGRQFPLTLSSHIAMEQSYGYIDGDSATVAEYCSLLSAITQAPVNQHLAITGSMNQLGEVQAIGGVNEKIEGFFKLCQLRGLNGRQGVIIPADNQKHLMLHQSVIDAVEAGQFHIYSVRHVYQALALLMDREPGEVSDKGEFPESSLNGQAQTALKKLFELYQETEEGE
ncbi:Lon protease family protein [Reinekea blandensis]|uniref:endopeptidase La n=1 Tax=Reinekea blandensis MED297 TaxID=314283 RepID=A4B9D3_9GAMM|nr:ATP-binding protein [Reinekea blandensis]EAR11234.1 ATP-dependent protease, putative [Reinekea sp. MED297] [Reinekea blandensis MED297]